MHAIALLLLITAAGQTPPPDEPPPLEPGEKTYEVELLNGEIMYGRSKEVIRSEGRGYFWIDEPKPRINNATWYEFKSCVEEFGDDREVRWKEAVAEWRQAHGYVQPTLAESSPDGSPVWVTAEENEWANRARAAALDVIQQREAREAAIADMPALGAGQPEVEEGPGLVELWGPQAAIALLGLVLMAVAARFLIFPRDDGWQKID